MAAMMRLLHAAVGIDTVTGTASHFGIRSARFRFLYPSSAFRHRRDPALEETARFAGRQRIHRQGLFETWRASRLWIIRCAATHRLWMGITPAVTPGVVLSYGVASASRPPVTSSGPVRRRRDRAREAAHAAGLLAAPMLAARILDRDLGVLLVFSSWGLQPEPLLFSSRKISCGASSENVPRQHAGSLSAPFATAFAAILRVPFSLIAPTSSSSARSRLHSPQRDAEIVLVSSASATRQKLSYPLAPLLLALVLAFARKPLAQSM